MDIRFANKKILYLDAVYLKIPFQSLVVAEDVCVVKATDIAMETCINSH